MPIVDSTDRAVPALEAWRECGDALDACLASCQQALIDIPPDDPAHANAEAQLQRIFDLIDAHVRAKLTLLDEEAKRSGLAGQLQASARAANEEAQRLRDVAARVNEITAVVDKLSGLVKQLPLIA